MPPTVSCAKCKQPIKGEVWLVGQPQAFEMCKSCAQGLRLSMRRLGGGRALPIRRKANGQVR